MRRWLLLSLTLLLAGCSKEEKPAAEAAAAPGPVAKPAPVDARPVIVAFGDSLTAGYGLDPGLSYADFLQKEIDRKGYQFRVVNQGISGDTTDGGVSRLEAALLLKPAIVILELGANDGLRGLPVAATRANLTAMVDGFQKAGARVLLAGMTLPRNYGADYIGDFEQIFRDLKREKKLAIIPFFLEGVATQPELMQRDGMHPTAEGCRKVALHVMKYLEPMLR